VSTGGGFPIHAHRVILSAGSGYFKRVLQEPKFTVRYDPSQYLLTRLLNLSQGEKIAKLDIELDDMAIRMLRYMYGIDILTHGNLFEEPCLRNFVQLATFADKYEVIGLSEHSFKTACLSLDNCIRWLDLERFLNEADYEGCHVFTTHNKFMLRFFAENFEKLRETKAFHKLLVDQPGLEDGMTSFAKVTTGTSFIVLRLMFKQMKRNSWECYSEKSQD
jgi:hypothetical protein